MGEYEDMASFASMFSNSNAGGKMPKKKSASARQKAKAKGMKGAAYIALGKPAGKKSKNSGGKGSKSKGSSSKGSSSSSSSSTSSKSKPMTNTGGSPYVTSAVTKAKGITAAANSKAMTTAMNTSPYTSSASTKATNKAFTSPYLSAGSRSAKPVAKPMSAADMKSSASVALGNPRTTQVRAKSTKTTTPVKTTKGSQSRTAPPVKASTSRTGTSRGTR